MNKVLLLILDGWGINPNPEHNAIAKANPPFWNELLSKYPNTTLHAREESVGLSKGHLSGSEVGHLAIASGRIVWQSATRIDNAIETNSFENKDTLIEAKNHLQSFDSTLHLVGMLSDAAVHSHIKHLFALINWAKKQNFPSVAIHLFLDGRDMLPQSALPLLKKLKAELSNDIKISTVCGRSIAMDRNENWGRTVEAFENLIDTKNSQPLDPAGYIEKNYADNITDEFLPPANFTDQIVKDDDAVLFFNFRADRMRQMVKLFTKKAPDSVQNDVVVPKNLFLASITEYADEFTAVHILFPHEIPKNTLGEWISKQGLKQFRIAETEKYAHVTFFFNGGRETEYPGESRLMIPSLGLTNYASNPEMGLPEITKSLNRVIENEKYNLIVANFANGDMVGHSGNMEAGTKAVQAVDQALSEVITQAEKHDYTTLIVADHGNIEHLHEADQPHTAHTHNDVPLIITNSNVKINNNGYLNQVAPTVLKLMDLPQPDEMTSESLIV